MPLATALVAVLAARCWAGAGLTQAEFLKVGLSPRAASMGGAFGAVADDLGALEHNPAGLAQLSNSQVSAMYVRWISDIQFASLAGAHVVPALGTVGFSWKMVDLGGGLLGSPKIEGSAKDFAATSHLLTGAWSRALRDDLCVGAGAEILSEDIADSAAAGFALNGGALYTPSRGVSLGFTVFNLGTAAAFESQKNGLPLTVKASGAWKAFEGDLGQVVAALDLAWIPPAKRGWLPSPAFGVEYWGGRYFAVRAGYTPTDTDLSELVGFAAGVGARWRNFRFDLSYAPFSALGQAIRGAVNWEIWPLVTLPVPGSAVGELRTLTGARAQLPSPPYLTAEAGEGSVLVKWEAPQGSGLAGYNVYYKSEGAARFSKFNEEPTQALSVIVGGLAKNIRYFFVVKAVDDARPPRESAASPQSSAIPY